MVPQILSIFLMGASDLKKYNRTRTHVFLLVSPTKLFVKIVFSRAFQILH